MSNNSPMVSVIIPVYDVIKAYNGDETILRNAINSWCNQDYNCFEVLILDNNSSDNTYSICKEITEKYSNIHLYKNEFNIGCLGSIQKLLEMLHGEYTIFAAGDDIYHHNYLSEGMRSIKGQNLCWHCSTKTIYQDKETFEKYPRTILWKDEQLLIDILFKAHDKYSSLNNFIHGIVPTPIASEIFKYRSLFYYETSIPILLTFMSNGIISSNKVLYDNIAYNFFHEKYPEDIYTKQSTSIIFNLLLPANVLCVFIILKTKKKLKMSFVKIFKFWTLLVRFYFYRFSYNKVRLILRRSFPFIYKKLKKAIYHA